MLETPEATLHDMAAGLRVEFAEKGSFEEKPQLWQEKFPALSIRVKNDEICMFTLMVLVELRYYQVTVLHNGIGCADEKDEARFVESFRITD